MSRKPRTLAARARTLHARQPGLTPSEIADRIGSSRQAVEAALSVTHTTIGRPGVDSEVLRLSSALLRDARKAAKRDGVGLREWIEHAMRSQLPFELRIRELAERSQGR